VTNQAKLLLLVAAGVGGILQAGATTEARGLVDRLREQLPSMSVLTDAEMGKFAPGEYEGDAKLYLLPNGRYYYFVWSEAGPNTKFYDTGSWTHHEAVIELAANPANIVLKRTGKSFLVLKAPQDHTWIEAYAIEVGDQIDRFEAEARTLGQQVQFKPKAGQRQPDAIQLLFETRFSLRRGVGGEKMVMWYPVALDAQNRLAATIPAFRDRISEFQERGRQYVPKLTGVRSDGVAQVAGHYTGNWGMGGRDLYLLPDGGYYYTQQGDLPSITQAYEKGSWTVRGGVVELIEGANFEHAPDPGERRLFVMRAPLPADPWANGPATMRLILVGTNRESGAFLSFAAEQEGAILADKADPKSASAKKSLLYEGLGAYNSIRFAEPISLREVAALRKKFDAENREDAAAWEAEKQRR